MIVIVIVGIVCFILGVFAGAVGHVGWLQDRIDRGDVFEVDGSCYKVIKWYQGIPSNQSNYPLDPKWSNSYKRKMNRKARSKRCRARYRKIKEAMH